MGYDTSIIDLMLIPSMFKRQSGWWRMLSTPQGSSSKLLSWRRRMLSGCGSLIKPTNTSYGGLNSRPRKLYRSRRSTDSKKRLKCATRESRMPNSNLIRRSRSSNRNNKSMLYQKSQLTEQKSKYIPDSCCVGDTICKRLNIEFWILWNMWQYLEIVISTWLRH